MRVRVGDAHLYVVPSGVNEARVRAVLPTRGSEDVSSRLTVHSPDADLPTEEPERDYLPDPATDWVIDLRFEGDPRLDPRSISSRFDAAWYKRHGSMTIFALDVDTGRWTFLISADGPKHVTRLKVAWAYVDPIGEDPQIPPPEVFTDRRDAVLESLRPIGQPSCEMSLPPDKASDRAHDLRDIKRRLDYSPTLALRASKGGTFEGRAIWDVMLCLGLRWGDMDVFHWVNSSGAGDDYFFSVWTSSPPGYFFPEEIAAGKVRVEDLVFGFSAPRCAQPVEVFDSMVRAVEYARKRLGGTVVDEKGAKADVDGIRRKVLTLEQELKSQGIMPGGESALHLF